MAKEYNIGDRLYLPVWVTEKETNIMMGPDKSVQITDAKFSYAYWHGKTGEGQVRYGEPGLLLTTEEVAEEYKDKAQRKIEALTKQLEEANETIKAFSESEDIVRTNFVAKVDENKELKARNAELEALLKEVTATRDEAIRQINELLAENSKLKAGADKLKDTLVDRTKDVQHYKEENDRLKKALEERAENVINLLEENDKLKTDLDQRNKDFDAMKKDRDELDSIGGKLRAENENLKAWYEEANKTASEAAEANDELKAKIADLRNRVGEQLAQIQDLNAEIHFLKADRDKFAKNAKDKADLANKACDERNDAQGDLVTAKAAIDYLQEENKKLKQEHKDVEAAYDVVAETSIKRKNRITTMEEVIVALVEKIRRLESGD